MMFRCSRAPGQMVTLMTGVRHQIRGGQVTPSHGVTSTSSWESVTMSPPWLRVCTGRDSGDSCKWWSHSEPTSAVRREQGREDTWRNQSGNYELWWITAFWHDKEDIKVTSELFVSSIMTQVASNVILLVIFRVPLAISTMPSAPHSTNAPLTRTTHLLIDFLGTHWRLTEDWPHYPQ